MSPNCDARWKSASNLWLRNQTFYYIVELPRQNGKRRYLRQSLRTGNYYEALEKIKRLKMNGRDPIFNDIRKLLDGLIFESSNGTAGNLYVSTKFKERKLSKRNNPDDISELIVKSHIAEQSLSLTTEDRELLNEVKALRPLMQEFLGLMKSGQPFKQSAPEPRKISEFIDAMLSRSKTCQEEKDRKRNFLTQFVSEVGLTLDSDYADFHNIKMTDIITEKINAKTEVKGSVRYKYVQYIKELMACAHRRYSKDYDQSVIENLPAIDRTKKSETSPHLPYTDAQLLEIFNPKHDFFKKHPDMFFACMIAMFTGARKTAAITLQYDDIINEEGIDCIHFRANHKIKRLKNEASERIVPINPQLIELGFLGYVERRKTQRKASGTDFIFPGCMTRTGNPSNSFMRKFLNHLKKIKVKKATGGQYDFHSFRKTANLRMEKAGIPGTFINELIGWEGQGTREKSYSGHPLPERKAEMDKFSYDFLAPHFAKWKTIMAKK